MLDLREFTYEQMADLVRAIKAEVLRRDPSAANSHLCTLADAIDVLETIGEDS